MIYTVTLNPAVDYTIWVDSFQTGELNRTSRDIVAIGGKGINVSLVLKELGNNSVATGFIGGFTGDAVEKSLQENGIKTDFVKLPEGNTRINVKIKEEQETEINGAGPEISKDMMLELETKLSGLSEGDFLVLAGSTPPGVPADFYGTLIEKVKNNGVKIVVDATGKLLLNTLKHTPFLIKPNLSELEELAGHKLESEEQIYEAAESLQKKGAQNVLVSMGGDGAALLDSLGNRHRVMPVMGQLVNTVGAGDSMVAGFISGYIEKADFDYALKVGNATGAATAFSAELAKKEEIEKILHK